MVFYQTITHVKFEIYIDSKIGRQSNLFKQKLITNKKLNAVSAIESAKIENVQIMSQPAQSYELDIEESLEPHISGFIKNIYNAYKESIEVINHT